MSTLPNDQTIVRTSMNQNVAFFIHSKLKLKNSENYLATK